MKKRLIDRKCYMCDADSTSKEHVPPACLFPEEKDIKTSAYRNNLITVPSCDVHNSKKSKDDEFLMGSLAAIVGNNVIGYIHAHTKVKRSLERMGKDAIHVLMAEAQSFDLVSPNKHIFPVLVGRPDINRLRFCFEHIAYGLYFHKFQKKFEGKIHILPDFVTFNDEESEKYKLLCRKRFELEPSNPKKEGNNPEVFRYEFIEPDEFGLIGMRMTFYEGAIVFVAYQGNNTRKPHNLAMEFIKSGVRTTVTFPDGTHFEFN